MSTSIEARDELYLDRLSEAREEERFERDNYTAEIECGGCAAVREIPVSRTSEEPAFDVEACDLCGSSEWEYK